ncbi:hypothetical protein C8N46_10225 [Kordia periserrulae]|uniref:Uncharacterized protein n=1 Tax=Kordia periserrulae TaxID=701523 RepID=A0A2T6C2T9_9FLAO|nr:hypothetical protein [Kordia periserrulae]PTX62630.1 hypothetical protein C8N46_10225 [Kordia periserrulae]
MPIRKQDKNVFDNFELRLNESSKKFLREASKWAFVFSIIGFVFCGIMLFIGIFALMFFKEAKTVFSSFSEFPPYVYAIFYIIIAIVSFFPARYVYNFSRRIKTAIAEKNTTDLTIAFSKIKLYFKSLVLAVLGLTIVLILAILFVILINNG